MKKSVRLAVDIGGTFTDIALDAGGVMFTRKVLTTTKAPEEGVMDAVRSVLPEAGVRAQDVEFIVHGTTLATNTIIERKGARTALVVTDGFRDSVEMGYEHRFDQYDINIEKPEPLVPRYLRLPVTERSSAHGNILIPLVEKDVLGLIPILKKYKIESVAIALIHSYANSVHENRIAEIMRNELTDVWVTLSSDVCPEIREYERMSTASANAYVQPLMSSYLADLDRRLTAEGTNCPVFMMTSGGGLTTIETARRHPIRLVESGPAGGAILAGQIALECSLGQVLSYDMGGTTAKICLIDDGRPQTSRTFEVDRQYRFTKGSGLPLRIPVIEMVEIGAGGGSVASIDNLGRIQVGPESAGSEPGPACYGQGGVDATVTDADVILGRISPEKFAGGSVELSPDLSLAALEKSIAKNLNLDGTLAAFAVSEMVEENMSNAARVHAVEQGKELANRTLIAFGGAAPLHACRMAEKLGMNRVVIPQGAGVGSAIGFLAAPISYEMVRSRYTKLDTFSAEGINSMFSEMYSEAYGVVSAGSDDLKLEERRIAYMRYIGQGHEIVVEVPNRTLTNSDGSVLKIAFDRAYEELFGRVIPSMEVEILTWALSISTIRLEPEPLIQPASQNAVLPNENRKLFDAEQTEFIASPVYQRDDLLEGMVVAGPALIVESQTTTVVTSNFNAVITGAKHIDMKRKNLGKLEQ